VKNGLQNFAFNKFNALYHYLENYAHSFNTGGQPGAARGAGSAVNRGLLTPPPVAVAVAPVLALASPAPALVLAHAAVVAAAASPLTPPPPPPAAAAAADGRGLSLAYNRPTLVHLFCLISAALISLLFTTTNESK
jgi:hypothetical protein